MRKWTFDIAAYSPAFTKRLWFQLALIYTVLAFCAMTLLMVLLYGIDDYHDFHAAVTLENVEKQVVSEKLSVAQFLYDAGNSEWRDKARDNIREKLVNMERGDGSTLYRITSSCLPEVYIQITDRNGRLLLSDPSGLPERVAARFATQQKLPPANSHVTWLAENGPIWVDMPITDARGGITGRLRVLYIAEFNLWVQFKSIINFLLHTWNAMIFLAVPIGIACGLVAASYVKGQLQKMNEVTESWRQGNFSARIVLPNDDLFLRHSQHLNDMAQDLELFLSLKKNVAVRDERTRLARELHDTVKQKLFALGLQLGTAKSIPAVMEAAGKPILEAETITREAQHDLMEIITQLRLEQTGETSLFERIGTLAEDFKRRFSVTVELAHPEAFPLDAHTEHQVLRIVQEALMNAVRHGNSTKVAISGKIDRGIATLTISDNGRGFDTGKKTEGFGIASMRDRARELPGGKLEIESGIGSSTKITLSWGNVA